MTPWTVAYQAPPSLGFSRQEYWSGLPSPSPGDLPDPGIEPRPPALLADALTSEPPGKPMSRREKSKGCRQDPQWEGFKAEPRRFGPSPSPRRTPAFVRWRYREE